MKEYKFRAKPRNLANEQFPNLHPKANGDFSYGTGLYNDGVNTWLILENNNKKPFSQLKPVIVYPETVGQHVDLEDKNKVEIYEGDIVRVSEEYGGSVYIPLVVDFKDGCFVLRPINNISAYNPIFEYDFTQVYEVIGNRYDNPDLMEF